MTVKDKISFFVPSTYDRFHWWRRFKPRQTLSNKAPLYDKIKNGDYEMSDYFYQAKYEIELLEQLGQCSHEVRGLCMERYRRLMKDYERDENEIMSKMTKDFSKVFKLTKDEFIQYMDECEGTLLDLYNTIKQDYQIIDSKNIDDETIRKTTNSLRLRMGQKKNVEKLLTYLASSNY